MIVFGGEFMSLLINITFATYCFVTKILILQPVMLLAMIRFIANDIWRRISVVTNKYNICNVFFWSLNPFIATNKAIFHR